MSLLNGTDMPSNDAGEFELVLGNKQLLSVFFIVVVLLGVFFTMGYIVGRNSGAEAANQMAAVPGQPLVVESETPSTAQTTTPPPDTTETPTPPAPTPPPAKQQATPPKPVPTAKPVTKPKLIPPPPPVAVASPSGVQAPAAGQTFLQVAATSLPEGEVLRDVLTKRGFRCQLGPVPGQDLVRVLVGPVNGEEEIAETRTKLRAAGFQPFTRKYK